MLTKLHIVVHEMDVVLRDAALLATVRSLTLNPGSGMNQALDRFQREMQRRPILAKAIMGYEEAHPVGWALFAKDEAADRYRLQGEGICFQVFVLPHFRRRGYGSQLLEVATRLAGNEKLKVFDDDTPGFFAYHKPINSAIESIYHVPFSS